MPKPRQARPMLVVLMPEDEKLRLKKAARFEGHRELASWVRMVLNDRAHKIILKFTGRDTLGTASRLERGITNE